MPLHYRFLRNFPGSASVFILVMSPIFSARAEPQKSAAAIDAEIYGLKNDDGKVGCLLFAQAEGFPSKSKKAKAQLWVKVQQNKARCTFEGLVPGWYAVAVLHDANNNAKMDTNFVGIPSEGYGASNDVKGFMGPPKFADAKIEVSEGTKKVRIKMNY